MNTHPMNEVEKLFIRILKTATPSSIGDEVLRFNGEPEEVKFQMLGINQRRLSVRAGLWPKSERDITSTHPEVLAAFDEAYAKAKADEPFVNHSKIIVDSLNSIISKPS